MVNNEKELDKTGYDDWKLSNRDDEMNKTKKHKEKGWGTMTYNYVVEKLGTCPYCHEDVKADELFVEEKHNVYHYSCYNYLKANEENGNTK